MDRESKLKNSRNKKESETDDLFHDLAGGVEVDEALVNLHLIAIPGLGTLTARLEKDIC